MINKNKNKLRVGIVGLGMVGEPIRKWFEEVKGYKRGKDLFCFDVDKKKGHHDDVNQADVIFVSVPTPTPKVGSSDLSIVYKAVESIKDGAFIVIKSTIPPGTIETLQKKFPYKKFIFNPEFLTETQVWSDFIRPDRQILGPSSTVLSGVSEVLPLLPMAPFMRPWSTDYSKKDMNATEAEMIKYASNVFGYIKVIYANMLADISTGLSNAFSMDDINSEVHYENIREAIGADPRIGPAWLNVEQGSYSGAGGFCFPKDMNAFIAFIETDLVKKLKKNKKYDRGLVNSLGLGLEILKAVRSYNRGLLKWQGLTEGGISIHGRYIDATKRKPIRLRK